jgi:hypothetical protein
LYYGGDSNDKDSPIECDAKSSWFTTSGTAAKLNGLSNNSSKDSRIGVEVDQSVYTQLDDHMLSFVYWSNELGAVIVFRSARRPQYIYQRITSGKAIDNGVLSRGELE